MGKILPYSFSKIRQEQEERLGGAQLRVDYEASFDCPGEQGEEEPAVREEPPPGPAPLGAGGGAVWRPQGTAGWLLYILSLPARSAISALCRRPLLKQTLRGLGPYKGK